MCMLILNNLKFQKVWKYHNYHTCDGSEVEGWIHAIVCCVLLINFGQSKQGVLQTKKKYAICLILPKFSIKVNGKIILDCRRISQATGLYCKPCIIMNCAKKKVFRVCGKHSTVMLESSIKVLHWWNCNATCHPYEYSYLPLGNKLFTLFIKHK